MSSQPQPDGPSLALDFPAPTPTPDLPLPAEFDDSCKRCGKKMERMYPCYYMRIKPYATFQCTVGECSLRLLIYDAPNTPYLIWSDDFTGAVNLSQYIEERTAERERKRKARSLQHDT